MDMSDKAGSIRISQCMIVKNEEKNIERALSWGKDMVWERIVVDTGSTDRTVELAKAMGAAVYEFSWIDDFAAAKNFAIHKAKGEWIAFLDADEVFAQGDDRKLAGLLKQLGNTDADGVSMGWMQMDDENRIAAAGTQVRVFRNRDGLGYRRRIHEQLCRADGMPLKVFDASGISILHYGYCGDSWEKKKGSRRNLELILKELEENPGDYEMLGYLGDEYYAGEEFEKAEECYRDACGHMPPVLDGRDQRSAVTFLRLMQIVESRGGEGKELFSLYQRAVGLLPEDGDFDYLMGHYFAVRSEFGKGASHLEQALGKLEKFGSANKSMLLAANLREAYENLAFCCMKEGNRQKAAAYSTAVLKSDPGSMAALHTLMKAFQGCVGWEDAAGFLGRLYDFRRSGDRLLVRQTASLAGWKELTLYMEGLFTQEELEAIKKADRKEKDIEI